MAKFSKNNFKLIMREIEKMAAADQNIDVPIGILEVMYDDNAGWIDDYFSEDPIRDYDYTVDELYEYLIGMRTVGSFKSIDD